MIASADLRISPDLSLPKEAATEKERAREYNRRYRATHKEELARKKQEYYLKNQEQIKTRWRERYYATLDNSRKYAKEYLAKNRELINSKRRLRYAKNREQIRVARHQRNIDLKREVFGHYGEVACACCGEKEIEFLTIDHINGGGTKHRAILGRKGFAFYQWLKNENYPTGFRVLCYNCNCALGKMGYCPHKKPQVVVLSI